MSQSSTPSLLAPTRTVGMRANVEEVRRLLTKFDYSSSSSDDSGLHAAYYSYGTAGFRTLAVELNPIMVRVGLAAAFLSHCHNSGGDASSHSHQVGVATATAAAAIGVMITASHNTEEYNGVKLAGINGGMLDAESEQIVVSIVNERNTERLLQYVSLVPKTTATSITATLSTAAATTAAAVVVHLGRDTREHSVALVCLVRQAVLAYGGTVYDHGIVTTPMLHHVVAHANAYSNSTRCMLPTAIPVRLHTAGYYDLLVHSYTALLATRAPSSTQVLAENPVLWVDCACGVGYTHLTALVTRLRQQCIVVDTRSGDHQHRWIVPTNAPGAGPLNQGCGSEHVQKEQEACTWYDAANDDTMSSAAPPSFSTAYCASLDGDADRIVFFSSSDETFVLLDGDKIACLIGNFIAQQVTTVWRACGGGDAPNTRHTTATTTNTKRRIGNLPALGVVQTAYANGASTAYLTKQGVATRMAKTGVKHVHAAAHQYFDVGVYFEANGHGTVVFGPCFYDFLYAAEQCLRQDSHDESSQTTGSRMNKIHATLALQRLRILPALINQAVGDALSDLLLVDAILQLQGWTIAHWAQALYTDLPSRQLKVKVVDRSVVQTNDTETMCVAPAQVQVELDAAMQRCTQGRAFVRPSGTEDVVRIYAEAATAEQADALAAQAVEIVHRLCGGVGELPPAPTHSRM